MRRFVAVLVLLAGLTGSATAQTPADRQAIQGAIAGQMEAFRHDDGAAAFGFATPDLRAIFRTPERFMAMVQQGYQPVYRPNAVTFGSLEAQGEHLVQRVEVVGPDGQPYLALYYMLQGADGVWRIDGCELTDSDALGT